MASKFPVLFDTLEGILYVHLYVILLSSSFHLCFSLFFYENRTTFSNLQTRVHTGLGLTQLLLGDTL